MNSDVIQQHDVILGYTLTRRIGSGGYGDVWEATAPGGLKKAVKIVYGFHDERRAQSELKSLDRIKEARHPFLLSLERIEIFQSQLIVVSELADKSLADLAGEFLARSESGVPRDELIGYMREAADALDYLNANFGLQHLDIKPENILIVSGHAKVADFGLVKDLRDISQSMMSGMTPAYAAPELFDGQPGPASDQYSLAMVYQEMLTMVRPFSGSTPAQLAAQHMHGKPDLRPLPISDQPVIAKALSKLPGDRYRNCVQFVEQLSNRRTRKKIVQSRVTVRETVDTGCNTVVFKSGGDSSLKTGEMSTSRLTFNSVELDSFPPPECDPDSAVFQPTIVIGLGGSASQVIQKIKQRIVARHGSMESLPALRLLCIDSDRDALARLSLDRNPASMSVSETLAVPLRRSEQYRQQKKLDLSWISRRWIYNVPRSLQTDGLRPLGRLVFADHFESICARLSSCIKQAMRVEHIATTCENLGLNPPPQTVPRLVVVSNISGGLGSGMTIDMAYTIRLMLAEQGINESETVGLLMHGNRTGREASLSTANAYVFMSELRHFADGGYPGDCRLGLPEFEDELPFDHTYGLKLNTERDNQLVTDLDRIAEYICLTNTTRCSVFFDASRLRDRDNEEFALRSFGVSVCGPGLQVQGQDAVERLSQGLIDQWINGRASDAGAAKDFAGAWVVELGLGLEETTTQIAVAVAGLNEWKAVQQLLASAPQALDIHPIDGLFSALESHFDAVFDVPHCRSRTLGTATELCLEAEAEIASEAQLAGDSLATKILELFNRNHINFAVARKTLHACRDLIVAEHESVMQGLNSMGRAMQEMRAQLADSNRKAFQKSGSGRRMEFINTYGQLRFQEFTLRCCNDFYLVIKSCLNSTDELIKKFCMQVEVIGKRFDVAPEPKRTSKSRASIQQMLVDSVDQNRRAMIEQIERMVLDSIASGGDRFLDILSDSTNWQQHLPASIREAAQSVLSHAFKNISIDEVISRNEVQPAEIKRWLNDMLSDAVPFVTDCGGGATLLLGQPRHAAKSMLPRVVAEGFDVQLKEISGTTGDLVLCFEAERILLANFAFSILKEAPEAVEIAKRIHSRDDIDWTTLADLM